jgi:hypothetical protein
LADEFDKAFGNTKKNEEYWKKRLANQGSISAAPERSTWRRLIDSIEETMRQGPAALIANVVAPAVETGDGRSYSERRARYSAKEKQRREDVAAVDPANSVSDVMADLAGSFIGSAVSDPTNLVTGGGKNFGEKLVNVAGIGAGADTLLQAGEKALGIRDEYDPVRGAINVAAGPAILVAGKGVQKGVQKFRTGRSIRRGASDPEFGLLNDTIVHLEGGGTLKNPKTSPKGAMGVMQVMPDTARDPGFGIRPWNGKTQEDLARVGRQYAAVMNDRYNGDKAKVLAAYNWGPGAVDKALRKHGADWLAHAPKETRNYVRNGLQRMGEAQFGERGPARPMEPEQLAGVMNDPEAAGFRLEDLDNPDARTILDEADDSNVVKFPDQSAAREDDARRAWDEMTNTLEGEVWDPIKKKWLHRDAEGVFDEPLEDTLARTSLTPEEKAKTLRGESIERNVLTPAERQEMDASVTGRPPAENTGYEKFTPYMEPKTPANDSNVHSLADARQTKDLQKFHSDLMKKVGDRVKAAQELTKKIREEGLLPFDIGTRFTTPKGRELKQGPWKVVGHYVDPKNPNRYGYRVERGKKEEDDYETGTLLVSDPKADAERIKRGWEPFDRAADVAGWKKLGKLRDILDDESGSFRPFGRNSEGESVPLNELPPESRLTQLLRRLAPMTGEQRRMYHEERSRRASSLSNLQRGEATMENVAQQFGSQRGQLPKKAFESIAEHFDEADFTAMANKINQAPTLLPFQKLKAHEALLNLLRPEGAKLPTPSQIKVLSEVYEPDFIQALLDNRTLLQKVWHNTKSTLNIPRAIMSSMDFSAPFRQGIGLVHKKEFWKALPHMIKMWGSEAASKDWINGVKSHPRWQLAHDAGLAITDPHTHFLADKEEEFMTDLAERIPFGIGKLIAASNRAYSGFLNKLRWDTFNNLIDQRMDMGETISPKALKQMGKFVNMATGRGDLGKTGNAAAPALSAMLFSPRLIASRVKTLASPVTYMKADPQVRKEAWKSLLAMSGYYLTLGGLAKYGLGMDVETDPRSPDFMKAKIGNTRYDFMAGYGQYIRLGAQILTDSTITQKGDEKPLTSSTKYKDDTRRDVAIRFFLNKLAPVPGLVSDWMEGSDPTGEDFTWKKAVASRMLPMASQDIADAIKEWGPKGAAMGLPGLFGWSVQTYEPRSAVEEDAFEKAFGGNEEDSFDKAFAQDEGDEFDKAFAQ